MTLEIDKQEFVKLYGNPDITLKEIATYFGISESSTYRLKRKWQVEPPPDRRIHNHKKCDECEYETYCSENWWDGPVKCESSLGEE